MRKDYEILGIQEDADEKKIKRAYFKLIREYSPEKNPERFQEIRAAYERLLEEKDKPKHDFQLEFPEDDSFALSMFDQIQQLLEEGDYAKALLTAQEGIKYYQEAECFLYMYARCCMLEGKNGKGVKAYEKLVERFPDKLFYKSELAKAYHIRGYQRKAYAMFQTAYKEGEREIDFLNLYSHCCYDREKYQESVQILQELVDSVPAEKTNQMILELLEAYTGLFMNCMAEPYPVEDVAEKCCLFLEQIEDQLEGYEEQIVSVLLFVRLVASRNHGKKLKRLVDKLKELVSEVLPDNMPTEMLDVFQMMEDDLKLIRGEFAGFSQDTGRKHEFAHIVKQSAGGCHHLIRLRKVKPACKDIGDECYVDAVIVYRVIGIVHIEQHVKYADALSVLRQ